jgi:8-oxo-dGTP diphosphatase
VCSGEDLPKFYIAVHNDTIIGTYALLRNDLVSRQDLFPWIACLYVDPDFRGKNFGARLVDHAVKEAAQKGFKNLYLCTGLEAYYEKLGWSQLTNGYTLSGDPTKIYVKETSRMEQKMVFGEKIANLDFKRRTGCYAVVLDDTNQKVAVVLTSNGNLFLPGGGREGSETLEACLRREMLEETGYEVKIGPFIGQAERYFLSAINEPLLNDAYFYLAELVNKIQEPIELDHQLKWIPVQDAAKLLFHEHHAWAVKKAALEPD